MIKWVWLGRFVASDNHMCLYPRPNKNIYEQMAEYPLVSDWTGVGIGERGDRYFIWFDPNDPTPEKWTTLDRRTRGYWYAKTADEVVAWCEKREEQQI